MGIFDRVKNDIDEWKEARDRCTANINKSKLNQNMALYAEYYSSCKVNSKLVLYMSFWGRGVIDNPYAIFQELMSRNEFHNLKHVWVLEDFDDNEWIIEKYKSFSNVNFVEINSKEYFKYLCEAKYLINNATFPNWFIKKIYQIYINTWHGTPLKSMGYNMKVGNVDSSNTARNFLSADYLLSANKLMTDMYLESYKLKEIYSGKIIQDGYPRNDAFNWTSREEILKHLECCGIELDKNKKVILYAPTWRQVDSFNAVINPDELLQVKEFLEENINTDQYQILIKPHQLVYKELRYKEEYRGLLIPTTIDTNEILSITDILISDYSSIFVDFMVLNRPILFYIPDLQSYTEQRGISISLDDLPGPVSNQLEDIAEFINKLDDLQMTYSKSYHILRESLCVYDDGNVTARIVDNIFGNGEENEIITGHASKKRLLIAMGQFSENDVSNAFLNLLESIDYDEWDVTAFMSLIRNNEILSKKINGINSNVRVLINCGSYVATLNDDTRRDFCTTKGLYKRIWENVYPWKMMEQEWNRNFGNAEFDYIVNFDGYDSVLATLLLCGQARKRSIWLHSDINADINKTGDSVKEMTKALNFNVSLYSKYDKLVSCSKSMMEVNRKSLSSSETYDKFTFASNLMDAKYIEECLTNEIILEDTHGSQQYLIKTNYLQEAEIEVTRLPNRGKLNFVTMGCLSTEGNQIALIQAFAKFMGDFPSSHLYIIGDGPLRAEIERTVKKLDLCAYVTLSGNISNPFAIMKRCSCFILPSKCEGYSIAILEARACELPIIVTDLPVVQDSLYPNGQLIINSDWQSIYDGLCAYAKGQVPVTDFDIDQYNQTAYEEFMQAIM